jgi:short-subunit dehydrogenase
MRSLAMVTGATGGLGKAFAVECARRGWDLFLTDLDDTRLAMLAAGLTRTHGVQVHHLACDLTDSEDRTRVLQTLRSSPWRYHALFNVAGTDFEGPFLEQAPKQLRAILRLNIEATIEVTHALVPLAAPTQTFRIVNVASLAAFFPMPVKATYAASKRFLLDFSLALRDELRAEGATVTVLCPAGMPTTDACVRAIEAQGLLGMLTTANIGDVAADTVDAALKGRAVVVPLWINRVLPGLGSILPKSIVTGWIGRRWRRARGRRPNLAGSHPHGLLETRGADLATRA